MKEFVDVTLLAVLQGVAEFLPISSSGHLVILQHILEVPEGLRMRLEVFLHAGTLLSIFAFYWRRLALLAAGAFGAAGAEARKAAWSFAARLLLSTLPAIALYFTCHREIDALVTNVRLVGGLLMLTGVVLLGTRFLPQGSRAVDYLKALFMGVAQAFALLPGVSRSGMTLAAARAGRVSPESAAEFSFLMSAPLILGGVVLEIAKDGVETGGMSWGVLLWGTALSAVVGYFSLVLLLKALKGPWFWLFGPYCLLAGLCTVLLCR